MNDPVTYFITWTTYGTWLPGDGRGWRKKGQGAQLPQPLLEQWYRRQLNAAPVQLDDLQRQKVAAVCGQHCSIRGWGLLAVNVRTNHVHVVVTADQPPGTVRDQLKANATRVLRSEPHAISSDAIWTRGGDCEIVNGDENLERVVIYVNDAQDRMERDA